MYQVRLRSGERYSFHGGTLAHDDLIGRPEGSLVSASGGGRLLALRPTFAERVTERKRRAQPIYPKDLAAILMHSDAFPGATVVEAGTGTGALTAALARAVGPAGRVIAYEVREEFLALAREAVDDADGARGNVEFRLGDVYQPNAIPETGLDRGYLDLAEPWLAVPTFAAALRPGGILFAHCPNVSQVIRFSEALREHGGFGLIETVEVLERGWTVRGRSSRPDHRMVAHTGFLTFARRLASDADTFETDSY